MNRFYKLVFVALIAWFGLLSVERNRFGVLGLGLVLVVGGSWALATAPTIWNSYLKAYKHRPKSKQNVWIQPRRRYYYLNLILVLPVLIALGIALLYIGYTM